MDKNKVLLVEDDVEVRTLFRDFLQDKGFVIHEADNTRSATRLFQTLRPDVTVADYELADGTVLELLPRFKAIDPTLPIVIVTAYSSLELAVRAGQEGARQFLAKPVELWSLHRVLLRLLERATGEKQSSEPPASKVPEFDPFLGGSRAIRELATLVERVLDTQNPVLLQGESGTGKGVLARWIHQNGPRSPNAFVDLNCAGLSGELLDTELFGHEKGAFTSATSSKMGLFEMAHRGTVFLDEIGDMQAAVQGKLLKAVEEKSFRRLGDVHDRRVDIRLIAASNRDLGRLVRDQRFRSDLYYRIAVFPIRIPSLRERPEDIPAIARDLAERLALGLGRGPVELTSSAVAALQTHSWPGNIRELKNVLERALLLSDGARVDLKDLPLEQDATLEESNLTLGDLERRHIAQVLAEEDWRVPRAAARLGIPRSSLYQKIKKLGLPSSR
jgi:DNA-binding NtrC family response regulator